MQKILEDFFHVVEKETDCESRINRNNEQYSARNFPRSICLATISELPTIHLHENYQADIPFSARLRKELVAAGKASLHHLYPNSGWITYYIHGTDDVPALLELLRLNYTRLGRSRVATSETELTNEN